LVESVGGVFDPMVSSAIAVFKHVKDEFWRDRDLNCQLAPVGEIAREKALWPERKKEKKKRKKKKEKYASSKKLLTSIKEKGPLGKKSPFTRKEESSQ